LKIESRIVEAASATRAALSAITLQLFNALAS